MNASTLLSLIAALSLTSNAMGALVLTIDNYTTSEVTLSISGSFDADVIGDQKTYLAVKNDWLNRKGINTPWIISANLTNNTVAFDGGPPRRTTIDAGGNSWGDSVFWEANLDLTAGTVVSGSVTLSGSFLPADQVSLDLVSGFDNSTGSWARLESVAVPEPVTIKTALFGMAGLALGYRRRQYCNCKRSEANAA